MIMLKMEKWENIVNETIKHFFDNYKVFDDNNIFIVMDKDIREEVEIPL